MMLRSYTVHVSCGVFDICTVGRRGNGYRICALELAEEHSLVSCCDAKALVQKVIKIIFCLSVCSRHLAQTLVGIKILVVLLEVTRPISMAIAITIRRSSTHVTSR